MVEQSNKVLVYLLIVLIGITLFGSTVSLIKLGKLNIPLVTGFQTSNQTARVNVTISATVAIRFTPNATSLAAGTYVDFGNGSLTYAPNLTTVNTTVESDNPSTFNEPLGLILENVGNVDVNVSIRSAPAASWISGTSPTYQFNVSLNETSACPANAGNLTTAITTFTGVDQMACLNLTYVDASDQLKIDIYLGIPGDAPPATYSTFVNVSGTRFCGTNGTTVCP